MEPTLIGRTALAVFAHPDDESLACGGTLARLADLGAAVVLVCASRGESGTSIDTPALSPTDLARVRCSELQAAARALGVSTVCILDHPDGWLRWAHPTRLRDEIGEALTRFNPDLVITFDDDGLYWHSDHVGVHEHTSEVIAALGSLAPPLYYASMADGVMSRLVECAKARHWTPPASGLWGIEPRAFGTPARLSTFLIDTEPWLSRKLEALQCHRSQMGTLNPFSLVSDADARACLGVERFRRAPVAGRRSDILERLSRIL